MGFHNAKYVNTFERTMWFSFAVHLAFILRCQVSLLNAIERFLDCYLIKIPEFQFEHKMGFYNAK